MILRCLILIFIVGCGDTQYNYISSSGKTENPKGWIDFCEKYNCEKVVIKRYGDLQKVFYPISDNFDYVPDVKESWDILDLDDLNGDCDDFAVTLRYHLLQAGFLKANARLATCYLNDVYHVVCLVEIEGQVYVCDQSGITPFNNFNVEWSSALDETGAYWVRLKSDNPTPTFKD